MIAATTGNPVATRLEHDLGAMLSESPDSARRRERTAFDEMAAPCERRLVLFGAGLFGRRTLRGLRRIGIEPLAFADNNPLLSGSKVDGLPVLSAADAAKRFGADSAFVLTIWNGHLKDRMRDRIRQLTDLGCQKVVPAGFLFWKYPDIFLPFYPLDLPHKLLAQADNVVAAFQLWADDLSRREYLAQIAFRLFLDFDGLSTIAPYAHYFPADIFRLTPHEVLVDCGAFDGDTIRSFVGRQADKFAQIVAYEPDESNWTRLQECVSGFPESIRHKIICFQRAVGAASGTVRFDATGTELSTVGTGTREVQAVALDESLQGLAPTLIKFDIEGAELDALAGVQTIARQHLPVLAVSAYHQQSHLWEVPLAVAALSGEYRLLLRPHSAEGWDLVCYAAPVCRASLPMEETYRGRRIS